jgi:4-amino-4-deoxy-L-arabinose transferase-like glycosyltransferase
MVVQDSEGPRRAMTGQAAETSDIGWTWRRAAFWATLIVGAALRFAALGTVPGGLNSDEASSGVEALSILNTGADLWGNHLPVWFPAWGSGMNALYTYLAVPVVWLFGLNSVTLRAVGAAFGVLTLPVTYSATRLYFGRDTALIATLLLALLPWHVMASRWALDSNLAPLFFTLGLYTIGRALKDGGRWVLLAFAPWAVAIYAYPVVIYAIVPGSIGILAFYWRRVAGDPWRWVAGIVIAKLIALPFGLFLLKNYLLHTQHLPLESALPFSVPALAATRLSQIGQSFALTVFNNLTFVAGGYRDEAIWHQSRFFLPLTGAAPFLTLAGAAVLLRDWRKTDKATVVLIVAAAIVLPILTLPLQLTRLNWFYIPSLMLAACFLTGLPALVRRPVLIAAALYLTVFLVPFYAYYFTSYNQEASVLDTRLGNGFRLGLEGALRTETALAQPGEPVFLAVGEPQPYLYPLFYGLGTVQEFQATRQMKVVDGVFKVSRFGRFVFDKDALPAGQGYVFLTLSTALPCPSPEALKSGPIWATGRCLR